MKAGEEYRMHDVPFIAFKEQVVQLLTDGKVAQIIETLYDKVSNKRMSEEQLGQVIVLLQIYAMQRSMELREEIYGQAGQGQAGQKATVSV